MQQNLAAATTETIRNEVAGACACMQLRKTTRIISRLYDEKLKPTKLKVTQFTTLSVISQFPDLSFTKLADIMGMERTTLVRNLRPLERNGLIIASDEGYKRTRTVSLTDKGFALMSEAIPLWRDAQEEARKMVGDATWQALQSGLIQPGV